MIIRRNLKFLFYFLGNKDYLTTCILVELIEKIKIITPYGDIIAELRRAQNPRTVEMMLNFLPMKYEVIVRRWGEEVFFYLPDSLKEIGYEKAKVELEIGDVAFWPRDPACCIFFGKTPLLTDDKSIAAEPVNVFASVIYGREILPKLTDGDLILMEKFE